MSLEPNPQSEGLYRILVDAITDYAIYMLNARGEVVSWNPGAERFKGYKASEILGSHFSRFYTPEDKATNLPGRALQMARTEGRFENEGWRVRKDSTRFWAHVVIDPIKDASGQVIGYAKVTRDLTERRKSQEALRSSEESLRRLIHGVTDYAIYMLDENGVVANWNAGAERIKGYRADEVVGKPFSIFYTDEDRAAEMPAHALRTAALAGRFEREGWRVRKDGTRFWANVVIDAIRDDDGRLLGFAKITRDITERTQAQRELEQAREQLFQAQKLESIGQLTGGIAHDFNNLLAAVMGSLELLRKRIPDDPRAQRLMDNAILGAERGISLTKRMLAYARRQDLQPAPVNLSEVVHGMIDLLTPSIGPSVALRTRFPADLPPAHTDPGQIETALLNLVVNARDAMPEGGTILVSAELRTSLGLDGELGAGQYVVLSVADTGQGMNPDTLERATEPFFTTKGVGKGTGLGLSMVQGLASQSGGRLKIISAPDVGTTVELWLPVSEQPAVSTRGNVRRTGHSSFSLRILAVDDDPLVLMNTSAMLEDLGHSVVEAGSGEDALKLIQGGSQFDLVITDHAMPHMTGSELAELLKQEKPDLPIIMATGYAELPKGAGRDALKLSKPFRQQELAEVIVQACSSESRRKPGHLQT